MDFEEFVSQRTHQEKACLVAQADHLCSPGQRGWRFWGLGPLMEELRTQSGSTATRPALPSTWAPPGFPRTPSRPSSGHSTVWFLKRSHHQNADPPTPNRLAMCIPHLCSPVTSGVTQSDLLVVGGLTNSTNSQLCLETPWSGSHPQPLLSVGLVSVVQLKAAPLLRTWVSLMAISRGGRFPHTPVPWV